MNLPSDANRQNITLLNLAGHHAGLPKNEGHFFSSVNDLYRDYAADPISCTSSTSELVHDCGCCDPVYMSLLGLQPTCGFLRFDSSYVTAVHLNGDLLGPPSLSGLSRPATTGEQIVAFGVGFGLPAGPLKSGSATQSGALSPAPQCQIGGTSAVVGFAGLISPGLFQLNLTVPSGGRSREVELVCFYGGQSTPSGTLLTV